MSKSANKDFNKAGNSVWHGPYLDHLKEYFFPNINVATITDEADIFLELYPEWIASSKLNSFRNLSDFPYRFVSLGVTQSLDWWHYYCAINNLRIRMFRGEYPYNRDAMLEDWTSNRYIDDRPLQRGDAVIISVPFSGSGRKHPRWKELMDTCNELDIPVFVDCAWFGTCFDIEVKLNHPCIKMVGFSTGKGLSCGNWRSGIVFSRIYDCSMQIQTEWKHGIHLNVAIANELMRNFSPDTVAKKYLDSHKAVCEHYGLETTNTIHIAVAPNTEEWYEFTRDDAFNRVNIRDAIKRHIKTGEFYNE
jgi:hypothetical protein